MTSNDYANEKEAAMDDHISNDENNGEVRPSRDRACRSRGGVNGVTVSRGAAYHGRHPALPKGNKGESNREKHESNLSKKTASNTDERLPKGTIGANTDHRAYGTKPTQIGD
jgi:hypothetical protein